MLKEIMLGLEHFVLDNEESKWDKNKSTLGSFLRSIPGSSVNINIKMECNAKGDNAGT